MELKIKDTFYMLELRKNKEKAFLYDNINEAIHKVALLIKNNISANDILLSEIKIQKDSLVVKGIPWSAIVEKLLKDEKEWH